MVYFRVDANEVIATGHVMRCLSIAAALKKNGVDSTFIVADTRSSSMINERGFETIVLNTAWNEMELELDMLEQVIREKRISMLVIDSYYVTKGYFDRLHKVVKLCYIDDLNAFVYPVDTVINYGFLASNIGYKRRYKKAGMTNTNFLLDCQYTPLREEFSDVSYIVRDTVQDVMITTGGTDSFQVAGRTLNCIKDSREFEKIRFHVVVGRFNQHKQKLYEMAKLDSRIKIYENISNMSELMKKCDVAVTAGGSTTYELCAVGIPSICLSIAANQKQGVKEWDEHKIMLYAGDMEMDGNACVQRITDHLNRYMHSYELRLERSQKMRKLVDGKGAQRIAASLTQ